MVVDVGDGGASAYDRRVRWTPMPSPRAVNVRTKGRCRSASAERPAALRPVLSERSSPRAIRSRDASAPGVGGGCLPICGPYLGLRRRAREGGGAYLVIAGRRSCLSGTLLSSPHHLEDFACIPQYHDACIPQYRRPRLTGGGRPSAITWKRRHVGCRGWGRRRGERTG